MVCGYEKDYLSCALFCYCSHEDTCYNLCTNTEDAQSDDEEGDEMENAEDEIVKDERTKV